MARWIVAAARRLERRRGSARRALGAVNRAAADFVRVEEPVRKAVILVHGLWMGGWAMQGLRLLLSRRGYAATALEYRSMAQSLDEHARRLAARIRSEEHT